MCPPPTDPIRPLGPVTGDAYVERAELPWGMRRRTQHEDETPEQRRRRRRREVLEDGQLHRSHEQLDADAGTYDDHGRASTSRGDEEPPSHRHVDATA